MFREKLHNNLIAFTFADVILLPGYSEIEPEKVDLSTYFSRNVKLRIPLASAPMDTVTEDKLAIELAKHGAIGIIHRNLPTEKEVELVKKVKSAKVNNYEKAIIDDEGRLIVGAAISPFDKDRIIKLDKVADVLVVDVAHFHTRKVIEAIKRIENKVEKDLVVGNIGTYEAAEDIITKLEKIDGIRVGLSSGSICITAKVTGVAAPTLFAVASVADALKDYGVDIPVISDGGVRNYGDITKALALGASVVMSGYLFAGVEESAGKVVEVQGKRYKYYRGMASKAARQIRFSLDRYSKPSKNIEEGVEGLVPYKGKLERVINEIEAALKAAFGYVGAKNIRELWYKSKLAFLTPMGVHEVVGIDVIPY